MCMPDFYDEAINIKAGFDDCKKFMSLSNYGRVKLVPFDLDEFKELLSFTEECMKDDKFHDTLYVSIADLTEYEDYFLNLKTDVPIYFYSTINYNSEETTISRDVSVISLDEVRELDDYLLCMVVDIANGSLSPLERIAAVYDIVKSFKYKYYLKNEDFDSKANHESRNKYLILLNKYIVCRGYDNIFTDLLKRVGIDC